MRAKVFANGRAGGTVIVDADTGQALPLRVKQVIFHAKGGTEPSLLLVVDGRADIQAPAQFTIYDPLAKVSKIVKRIEFTDGSVFEPEAQPAPAQPGTQ